MLFVVIFLCVAFNLEGTDQDLEWVHTLKNWEKVLTPSQKQEAHTLVQKALKGASCKTNALGERSSHETALKTISGEREEKKYPDLLVFVSFSMPLESLKELSKQVHKKGGKLVFRGLYEGSFKKMAEKVKELSGDVLIDPTLFREHHITRVPVFFYKTHTLSGNVSLSYALEKIEAAL